MHSFGHITKLSVHRTFKSPLMGFYLQLDPLGLYCTPSHSIVHISYTKTVKLSKISSYLDVPSWRHGPWTSVKRRVNTFRFPNDMFSKQKQGFAHILKEGTLFSISVNIYYHMYLQQNRKDLEVDPIGSKVAKQKQEKLFFRFSCLGLRSTQDLSVLSLLP